MIKAKQERPLPTIKVTEGVPDDSMICKLQHTTMKKKHPPAIKPTSQTGKKSRKSKIKSRKTVTDSFSNITHEEEIKFIPKLIPT